MVLYRLDDKSLGAAYLLQTHILPFMQVTVRVIHATVILTHTHTGIEDGCNVPVATPRLTYTDLISRLHRKPFFTFGFILLDVSGKPQNRDPKQSVRDWKPDPHTRFQSEVGIQTRVKEVNEWARHRQPNE